MYLPSPLLPCNALTEFIDVTVGQGNVKRMYVLYKIPPTMTDVNHDFIIIHNTMNI